MASIEWRVGVVQPPVVVVMASTPQRGIQGGGEVRAQENKIKKFGKENTRRGESAGKWAHKNKVEKGLDKTI